MTSWLRWELNDDDGDNPTGAPGDFEFEVEYDFDPGDPGYQYDSNGDGYPGHAANVTLGNVVCKKMRIDNIYREPTLEEKQQLSAWFWTVLDKKPKIRDQIETLGLEQMSFEPDCDDVYD
jgi:hypothetical protein